MTEISNGEQGSSVRAKLNASLSITDGFGRPVASSLVYNPSLNEVGEGVVQGMCLAGGSENQPSYVGKAGVAPVGGTDVGWSADPDHSAGISSVFGGYDTIVNAAASHAFGCQHAMIADGDQGHNVMLGGSSTLIAGGTGAGATGRSAILSARRAAIKDGAGIYNVVIGGDFSNITGGSYGTILNGESNTISGGSRASIFGGKSNEITNASDRSATVGGQDNTIDGGVGSVVLGGAGNSVNHNNCTASGVDVETLASGGVYHGVDKIAESGDAQNFTVMARSRTTDASNESLDWSGINSGSGDNLTLPAVSSGFGEIVLVGMLDGSASGNDDGDYSQVAYKTRFGFFHDGTNRFLFKDGDETSLSSSDPVLDLDLVAQTNNSFTPAASPRIRMFSGGVVAVRVNGVEATAINWVATIRATFTKVTP